MSATFQPDDPPHPCIVGRNEDGSLEYDHEWTLKSDSDGSGREYVWLECENCGAQKEASYADLSDDLGDNP